VIALCSIFRNSEHYLPRYFGQVDMLREELKGVRLFLTEGDSQDNTWHALPQYTKDGDQLLHVSHGGPNFGSVDNEQRWQQIAQVVRPTLAMALDESPEVLVWVESDLIWDTGTMTTLIEEAREYGAVAPMILAAGSDRYYDTWGYRQHGRHFLSYPPYFPVDPNPGNNATTHLRWIDSCGSCFATTSMDALRSWDGHWPYPEAGLKCDPTLCVEHP
jgi:hypothetical protein